MIDRQRLNIDCIEYFISRGKMFAEKRDYEIAKANYNLARHYVLRSKLCVDEKINLRAKIRNLENVIDI